MGKWHMILVGLSNCILIWKLIWQWLSYVSLSILIKNTLSSFSSNQTLLVFSNSYNIHLMFIIITVICDCSDCKRGHKNSHASFYCHEWVDLIWRPSISFPLVKLYVASAFELFLFWIHWCFFLWFIFVIDCKELKTTAKNIYSFILTSYAAA